MHREVQRIFPAKAVDLELHAWYYGSYVKPCHKAAVLSIQLQADDQKDS